MTQVNAFFQCFLSMFVRAFLVCLTFFIIQPLHSKLPVFIGDKKINLSWKEAPKPSVPTAAAVTGYEIHQPPSLSVVIIIIIIIVNNTVLVNAVRNVLQLPLLVLQLPLLVMVLALMQTKRVVEQDWYKTNLYTEH